MSQVAYPVALQGAVCVCYQLHLSSCMRPEWTMTAAGLLYMAVFPSRSDNPSQSHAMPCHHCGATRSPAL